MYAIILLPYSGFELLKNPVLPLLPYKDIFALRTIYTPVIGLAPP